MDTTTALFSIEAMKEISDCDMQLHFSIGLLGLRYFWLGFFWLGFFWLLIWWLGVFGMVGLGFLKLKFRKVSIHRVRFLPI